MALPTPSPVKSKLYQNVPSSGYGSTYVPAGIAREREQRCAHVYVGGVDGCSYIGDDEEVEETQEE